MYEKDEHHTKIIQIYEKMKKLDVNNNSQLPHHFFEVIVIYIYERHSK